MDGYDDMDPSMFVSPDQIRAAKVAALRGQQMPAQQMQAPTQSPAELLLLTNPQTAPMGHAALQYGHQQQQYSQALQRLAEMSAYHQGRNENYSQALDIKQDSEDRKAQRGVVVGGANGEHVLADPNTGEVRAQITAPHAKIVAPKAAGAAGLFSPEAKEALADQWAQTGKPPSLGRAGSQYLPEIASIMAQRHPGVNLAQMGADFGANSHALTDLTKREATTGAFEATAEKNLDNFLRAAQAVPDWGNQTLNGLARYMSEKGGNPAMSAFRAAHEAASSEASKVLSGALGAGAVSDSGRHAAEMMLNPNATIEQQVAAVKMLRQDMAARKQANAEAISGTREKLGGGQHQPQGKVVHLSPQNAEAEFAALPSGAEYIGPDGVHRRKP